MNKILTIDPSGTGTTGIFFTNKLEFEFHDFQAKDWEDHLKFLVTYVREKQPQIIIYEHTNYVKNLRGKDLTSLFKLLGGITALAHVFDFLIKIDYLPVNQVKGIREKIYQKAHSVENLTYKAGRGGGWRYHDQRLSLHQLDAFLLYYLWDEKNKNKIRDEVKEK